LISDAALKAQRSNSVNSSFSFIFFKNLMSVKLCTRCTTRCLKHEIKNRNTGIWVALNVWSVCACFIAFRGSGPAILHATWFVTAVPWMVYADYKDVEWEEACKVKKD
jgi:hypothetical protein